LKTRKKGFSYKTTKILIYAKNKKERHERKENKNKRKQDIRSQEEEETSQLKTS